MSGPRLVAAGLAVLAVAILIVSWSFPGGSQGVPGPAVVPQILGAGLLAVAAWLIWQPGTGAPALVRNQRTILLTMALLAAYAVLWRVVPYGVLTGLVLLAFLKATGLTWRGAVIAAATMATTLQLLFERGLGVRFQ